MNREPFPQNHPECNILQQAGYTELTFSSIQPGSERAVRRPPRRLPRAAWSRAPGIVQNL